MADGRRIAVIGAAGFGGALCAAIVARHPELELTALTARSDAGRRHDELYPRHRVELTMDAFDADHVATAADAALIAYPHRAAAPVVIALRERGLKVVDLSADFRLDRERYERYYQPHEAPNLLYEAVYGLTEHHREAIAAAGLVAAPGCYATAALLALAPLRELATDIVVDAKSGVSGAGRESTETTHFVSVAENVTAYKVDGHRHRSSNSDVAERLALQVESDHSNLSNRVAGEDDAVVRFEQLDVLRRNVLDEIDGVADQGRGAHLENRVCQRPAS